MKRDHLKCFRIYRNSDMDKDTPATLGIDEAGRGPVLGPMVYAGFLCPIGDSYQSILKVDIGVNDSKKLTKSKREQKFFQMNNTESKFGMYAEIITPQYISYKMLQREKHNLNSISQDSTISIIRKVLLSGYNLKDVYIDALGETKKYEEKLKLLFPNVNFVVVEKADSIYPVVSSASIIAKVIRDNMITFWRHEKEDTNTGSGYPGDPITRSFLAKNVHKIFGFPDIVRYSWSTAKNMLCSADVTHVEWYDQCSGDEERPVGQAAGEESGIWPLPTVKRVTRL